MAGLNTLRTKGGLFLTIVIGVALLLFIITLAFEHGGMSGNDPKVASINGQKITYLQYQEAYDATNNMLSMMNGLENSNDEQDMIHTVAWQTLLNEYVINPGFDKLGIVVSENERVDLISGQYVSPVISQAFANPATGIFNPEDVVTYLQAAEANAEYGPMMRQRYEYLVGEAKTQRLMDKYIGLVVKGLFVNDLEVAHGVDAVNKTYAGRWVGKKYSEIPDSTVTVSQSEISKFYEENKRAYKQLPTRSLSYVIFEVLPTDADRLAAANEVEQMAKEFAAAENPMIYAKSKSRESVDENYYSRDALSDEMAEIAFGKDRSTMLGPILKNDIYHLSRVSDLKMLPDSVAISYIVLAQNADKADSIYTAAVNGADFAELARQYSEEQASAADGGKMGVLPYSAYPEEFRENFDKLSRGDIFQTQLGQALCIVRIDRKDTPVLKAQIATITYPINPSATTEKEMHSKASQFSVAAKGSVDNFNAAASENALVPRVARVTNNDRAIGGLEDSREIVRWAFGAKTGDVSEIFTIDGNFVVAMLADAQDGEYVPVEGVAELISNELRNQKKYDMLAAQLNGKSLEEAAAELGTEVEEFKDIRFASFYIDGIGVEPRLIGAITAAEEGAVTGPVNGLSGVYMFVVDSVADNGEQTADKERVRLQAIEENVAPQRLNQTLYQLSDIEDMRVKYF